MKDTLDYGRRKGWKQIIFGHIGREPEKSLSKVRARLAEILGCEVGFHRRLARPGHQHDQGRGGRRDPRPPPGGVILLENTRKYDVERVLWKAKPADLPKLAEKLAKLANELAAKVAKVYVHEAFSAGSLDASSVVVPAGMDRVALGIYEAEQFDVPVADCLNAQLVIFSGLKADKLDDMEAMINRGKIRMVITAGSLSCPEEGGRGDRGQAVQPGRGRGPGPCRQAVLHPPRADRAGQADAHGGPGQGDRVRHAGRFRAPGRPGSRHDRPGQPAIRHRPGQQRAVRRHGRRLHRGPPGRPAAGGGVPQRRVRHVRGPAVRERHEEFRAAIEADEGRRPKVYIGGGEGGTSLEKYGQPDWVTYVFTAGGTVLNALGSEPVPYLVALKLAAVKACGCGCGRRADAATGCAVSGKQPQARNRVAKRTRS